MSLKSQLSIALRNPGYTLQRGGNVAREHINDVLDGLSPRRRRRPVSTGREYLVTGLRRSGNHAVINWIEQQCGGEGFHLNNLRLGENPYRYAYDVLVGRGHPRDAWIAKEMSRYACFQGEDGLSRLAAEARQEFVWKDYLIHSYEDLPVRKVAGSLPPRRRQRFFGRSHVQRSVLILRDPFNLIASRLHSDRQAVKGWRESIMSVWLEHAREFVGEQNLLPDKVVINFNRWAADRDYRRDLAERLGLTFTDAGIDNVPVFGGGSSFDRRSYDGSAQEMDVTSRWRRFADDPEFRAFFDRPEIFSYARRIFGEIAGTESLQAG